MAPGGSNRLITAQETAALLNISVDTVYRRWHEWGLRGLHVGRSLRFRERDIANWLDRLAGTAAE